MGKLRAAKIMGVSQPIGDVLAQSNAMAREGEMIDPQAEEILLTYINATPELLSLLYDCDLLPEQVQRETLDWDRMLYIADHWRARELKGTK